MSFNIGGLGSFIQPLVQSAMSQIEPKTKELLQGIAGGLGNLSDLFGGGAQGADGGSSGGVASSLPDPMSSLSQLFSGAGSMGGLDNLLGSSSGEVQQAQQAYSSALGQATGSTSSASTASSSSTVGASYSSFSGTQDINIPPMPSSQGQNLKDPNVMAKYQEDMQFYTQMVQLRSKIAEMLHDTRKGIIQSMRA